MIFFHTMSGEDEALDEEEEETESGIDDSMLDEISDDAAVDEPEGFGHIKEDGEEEEEEEEAEKETEDVESLEEDAEDVDYDSFDDEDHL